MKQAGFTLPEVLIGLSVGAVAVLIAGAGVAAALKARAANLDASVAVEDIAATVSLENRLVARATPVRLSASTAATAAARRQPAATPAVAPANTPPPSQTQARPSYAFEGDESTVSFVTALWGDPGAPGLWHVTLQLAPSSGADHARQHLVVGGHPYRRIVDGQLVSDDATPNDPAEQDQKLAEGELGAGARFAYAGRNDRGEIEWKADWKPEDGWPVLVSLDPDGEGPTPAAVVRLPDEGPTGAPATAAARPLTPAGLPLPGARP